MKIHELFLKPVDRPIDGVSLLPAFQNKQMERGIPLYWRCAIAPEEFKIALRQGDHTLLANPALTRFELYNLKTDIGERVLNHAMPGLQAVYNRHNYLAEKRTALTLWADHVLALTQKRDESTVVAFRTAAVA